MHISLYFFVQLVQSLRLFSCSCYKRAAVKPPKHRFKSVLDFEYGCFVILHAELTATHLLTLCIRRVKKKKYDWG